MKQQCIYLVGYFYENEHGSGFNPINDYRAVTADPNTAQEALKYWCKKFGGTNVKVYRINCADMQEESKGTGLTEFGIFREQFILSDNVSRIIKWWRELDDGFLCEHIHLGHELKFNDSTNTATVRFTVEGGSHCKTVEEYDDREKAMLEDLDNLVVYRFIPFVKRILQENNLNIRVDFKYINKKINKGFITKE